MTLPRPPGWLTVLVGVAGVLVVVMLAQILVRSHPPVVAGETLGRMGPGGQVQVAAYYLDERSDPVRLVREWRDVLLTDTLYAAVRVTVLGSEDPQHVSAFPQGTSVSVERRSTLVTVTLDSAYDLSQRSQFPAMLAVQAIVRTVREVLHRNVRVLIRVGDSGTDLYGIDTSRPF